MTNHSTKIKQYALFAVFLFSGFSGLIYESVWTNYLKLFLGHAAYAQTLVLALFMGGMAGGAWLAGRFMSKLKNPLLCYAAVELVIGLFGLSFHKAFLAATGFMLDQVLPGMEEPLAIQFVRWSFAALLILPQTLMLGATFPLISVGILRAFPHSPGSSISMLYFTNSIGAVAGVLISGFVLLALVGLPGTILTAALINILLAIIVYGISKQLQLASAPEAQKNNAVTPIFRQLLLVAMITGLSSFIYEISWIRMLTMVLGASTHAFELMLSAFILGLALGGLWLRKRIDNFGEPLRALGSIQFLMGLFALGSVLIYNHSFDLMSYVLLSLHLTEGGYTIFTLTSHLISLGMMLPVTFMAGMTLPLITLVLFKSGGGEAAIGKVYAFNTLGAIFGVALSALILLPVFGLKNAVIFGAALDLGLALYLFGKSDSRKSMQLATWLLSVGFLCGAFFAPEFDHLKMAGGVFRDGSLFSKDSTTILMHHDGRTATVDVFTDKTKSILAISTNGKPDASVMMDQQLVASWDESTMVMLGGLPVLAHPKAQKVAVIGMGAGMSADILLTNPNLKNLDIIEIEAGMVAGAKMFGPASARVFSDPRSHVMIDDAKSYFSAHKKRYDVILSEPSDSWVSGVSSLFADEFYGRIQLHLADDGLLVQWMHLYETSPILISSIFKALGNNFSDYKIYASNNNNLVVLAKVKGKVPALNVQGFENLALRQAFKRIGLENIDDIRMHELGDKATLGPVFDDPNIPMNSDFFPFVDQHAAKARFLKTSFNLQQLIYTGLPIPGIQFDGELKVSSGTGPPQLDSRTHAQAAPKLIGYLGAGAIGKIPALQANLNQLLLTIKNKPDCTDPLAQAAWHSALVSLAKFTIPFSTFEEFAPTLRFLNSKLCETEEATQSKDFLQLMTALSKRDMVATELAAEKIISVDRNASNEANSYAIHALLLSYFKQAKWEKAQQILSKIDVKNSLFAQLVSAHARANMAQKR